MEVMNVFIIILHLALLPLVFHLLKFLRLEEMFKRHTPDNMLIFAYLVLTIAITQLVIQYFVTVFTLIETLF
ncbi:MAG: hypothetical protein FWG67_09080 [Defluviitaleaceae bacterium]|nr:hypothetical protein [Defluviitaleaceae bacterium]